MYERAQDVLDRRRRVVVPGCAIRGRSTSSAARAERVWDVDGNEYVDFHNGFGSMVAGPRAPGDRRGDRASAATLGTHFAAPTEDGDRRRRGARTALPACRSWRYTNSGSEATMDAIRIARAHDGPRHRSMKIFGSYHGHHDTVMVSIGVEYDKIGDRDEPRLAARTAPASRRRSST